jgi:hypothetical protein
MKEFFDEFEAEHSDAAVQHRLFSLCAAYEMSEKQEHTR